MWSLPCKQTASRWFHGRKMRFCGMWPTTSVNTFKKHIYSDWFVDSLFKIGSSAWHLQHFAGSCHRLWFTVDSLWHWNETGVTLHWCQLYFSAKIFVLGIDKWVLLDKKYLFQIKWNKFISKQCTFYWLMCIWIVGGGGGGGGGFQ